MQQILIIHLTKEPGLYWLIKTVFYRAFSSPRPGQPWARSRRSEGSPASPSSRSPWPGTRDNYFALKWSNDQGLFLHNLRNGFCTVNIPFLPVIEGVGQKHWRIIMAQVINKSCTLIAILLYLCLCLALVQLNGVLFCL